MLYLAFAVLATALSIYWATDYYEESVVQIEQFGAVKSAMKSKHYDELAALNKQKKINKIKSEIGYNGQEAKAYFWKDLLLLKQNIINRPINSLLVYLVLLCTGIILAINFSHIKEAELILLLIGFISSTFAGNISNPVLYEIQHIYLFITPGRVGKKLFYLCLLSYLKASIAYLLLFTPLLFLGGIGIVQFLGVLIASIMMAVINISGKVIYTAIFPDDDGKNMIINMIKGFFNYVYYIPGAIIAGILCLIVYFAGGNFYFNIGCFGFAVGSFVATFFILLLSEKIFKHIEFNG